MRSCESQLIVTIQDLAHNIDSKGQTDVILLDFSKAFDKVPHKRLLYKLHHYGIRNSNIGWIQDFLVGRTQQVLLEGVMSSTVPVHLESPREVYSDRCFSSYSLMTFRIVSRRVQRFAYSPMIVLCIVTSEGSRMPSSSNKIWKPCSSGKATG